MEWRVFVPILSAQEIEAHAVPGPLVDQCARCLAAMERVVPTEHLHEAENRSDAYFITCADFGLKYRSGKKLEIKIRTHVDRAHGCEHFVKHKLKKHPVHEQCEAIVALLKDYDLSDSDRFAEMIRNCRCLEVSKQRRVAAGEFGKMEVCRISLPADGEHSAPRSWLSITVEPPSVEQLKAFLSSPVGRELADSLTALLHGCESWEGFSSFRFLQPVIGGYPLWTKYLSGEVSEDVCHPRSTKRFLTLS